MNKLYTAVIKHLKANGCEFVREGGRHSWWIKLSESTFIIYNKLGILPFRTTKPVL